MSNRVVITGLGAITPIGTGKDAFWQGLMEGKNGIGKITRFDASEYHAQIAGEVKDFDPTAYIDKKEAKRMDRYAQFAVAAAKLAIDDAKLDLENENLTASARTSVPASAASRRCMPSTRSFSTRDRAASRRSSSR